MSAADGRRAQAAGRGTLICGFILALTAGGCSSRHGLLPRRSIGGPVLA